MLNRETIMLPDFPRIKKKFMDGVTSYMRNSANQDPMFSQIRSEMHFEGNRMATSPQDGGLDESGYQELSGGIEVKREDIIAKGTMAFIEPIENAAEEIKKQKAEMLFSKMKEITEKTGNVVDGKGKPFSFELCLEALEKIQIDFNEDGTPSPMTLVVSPQLMVKIKEKMPEWEQNPEYRKRHDELMARKRKEWDDRESNRKLVD